MIFGNGKLVFRRIKRVNVWSPKFLSQTAEEPFSTGFVGLVPPLADESAQGSPYLCDACLRRHTSLPANVFTGHDASKNTLTRVNILGISFAQESLVDAMLYFFTTRINNAQDKTRKVRLTH